MYTEEQIVKDLKNVSCGKDFNSIQKRIRDEKNITWENLQISTKKEFANAMDRIHPCPQEYKDNPHIHYEIPHFCSPNKFNK